MDMIEPDMNDSSCLVVKNDGIGDLVITSGIIAELSRMFDGRLDLITCQQNREIVELMEGVRNSYYVSRDGLRFHPYISRMGLYIPRVRGADKTVINRIRKASYSHAIVLRRFIRQNTLIIMSFLRARHKYCAWQFPTNTTHWVARKFSRSYRHIQGDIKILSELDYYKLFVDSIFGSDINPEPRLGLQTSRGTNSRQRDIGICIGGHSATWPVGYWIDFINGIQSRGYGVLLFGGENDTKTGEVIKNALSGIENLTGKLSLIESMEMLEKMRAVIGNDTGMSHLASLVNDRVIIILGGGTFRRYFPWSAKARHHTLFHGLDCFDCDWECRYPQRLCLNLIRATDVLGYFDDVMSGKLSSNERNLNPKSCQYKVAWKRRPWENEFVSC